MKQFFTHQKTKLTQEQLNAVIDAYVQAMATQERVLIRLYSRRPYDAAALKQRAYHAVGAYQMALAGINKKQETRYLELTTITLTPALEQQFQHADLNTQLIDITSLMTLLREDFKLKNMTYSGTLLFRDEGHVLITMPKEEASAQHAHDLTNIAIEQLASIPNVVWGGLVIAIGLAFMLSGYYLFGFAVGALGLMLYNTESDFINDCMSMAI